MPLISVIVPVYKVEMFLSRCIDSILAQTFSDFELILIDDGSPDNSGLICDTYSKKDKRILVIHQKNMGLSGACNTGLESVLNSNSQWITFIDSDDWVHPYYLETMLATAEQTGQGVVVVGFQRASAIFNWDNSVENHIVIWNTEDYYVKHNVNAVVRWGKLYQKNLFQDIKYPVGRIHEDEFVTHKIIFKNSQLAVISQPLYAYFQNSEGITKSEWYPKRLDVIDAVRGQIVYFKKHNFNRALRFAARQYINCIIKNLMNVNNSTLPIHEKRKIILRLRALLRWALLVYGKQASITFGKDKWIIECACPKSMGIYWAVKNKLAK